MRQQIDLDEIGSGQLKVHARLEMVQGSGIYAVATFTISFDGTPHEVNLTPGDTVEMSIPLFVPNWLEQRELLKAYRDELARRLPDGTLEVHKADALDLNVRRASDG